MDDDTADRAELPTLARVQIRVDTGAVVGAASHLEAAADAARRLAVGAAGLRQGLTEPALGQALGALGVVCRAALDVTGLDLDLLGARARAGAAAYGHVEHGAVRAGPGR